MLYQTIKLYLYLNILTGISLSSVQEIKDELACNEKRSSMVVDSLNNPNHNKFWELAQSSLNDYTPCVANNCSCFLNTLKQDLTPFINGITRDMVDEASSRGTTYLIYEQKLYRSKHCAFPARCSGVEHFLKELLKKLPNVKFVLNTRDWPQINKHFGNLQPVFSFSKTAEYYDIQYPAWSFWEGGPAIKSYPQGMGRWDIVSAQLISESKKVPWEQKENIGFFRGSRTSEERDTLILLSREQPQLVDAQYTKNQAWKSPADTLHAEPAEEVSLQKHCRYKYLFNFRGVAASFRLKHLFLCGSLVIHLGDEWTEFFYDALKPWVHYIPMAAESTQEEITSMLKFLEDHDDLSRSIAARGESFIRMHLRLKDVKCYWRQLLKKYSKLLKFTVSLDPTLDEIG